MTHGEYLVGLIPGGTMAHGGKRNGSGRKPLCPGDKVDNCSFRICPKLHERLKAWCKENKTDKSAVINALVAEFLGKG